MEIQTLVHWYDRHRFHLVSLPDFKYHINTSHCLTHIALIMNKIISNFSNLLNKQNSKQNINDIKDKYERRRDEEKKKKTFNQALDYQLKQKLLTKAGSCSIF